MTVSDNTIVVTGNTKPVVKKQRVPLTLLAISLSARLLSIVMPWLAARWLKHIFMTPQKYHQPKREREWMQGAETNFFAFAENQFLPLYSWEPSRPSESAMKQVKIRSILLVHGLSGRGSQMGMFVQPLLDMGFRVVTFDSPAHGEADGTQTALPEVADALEKITDHLGPLHGIIAHSNGAAATTLALSRGIKANCVVYVSPPEDLSGYLHRLAMMIGFSKVVTRRTQHKLEAVSGMNFEAARGTSLAPHMKMPALIIHDNKDRMVPYDEGRRLAEAWPEAELCTTSGLGHSRILRDPEVVRRATQFLTQTI